MKLVLTNGCFDVLHRGHTHLLIKCASLGDYVIAAVNDDDSVRSLKGPTRPIQPLRTRLRAVSRFVNAAIPFNGNILEVVRALNPDVLVKGSDYTMETIVGAEYVVARGGNVVIVPRISNISTTASQGAVR